MSAYYEEYWARDRPPPVGDPLAPVRLAKLVQLAGPLPGARVVESGCGLGSTAAALAAAGAEVVAIDVSEHVLRRARERSPEVTFVAHSAERTPWPIEPASFDLAVSFEVVEHLLEPRKLVAGAYSALRSGGRLALTTPYHGRTKNIALAAFAFDRHFAVDGDHIRFFSDRALRGLLEDAGFVDVELFHYGRRWPVWAGVLGWARKP